MRPSLENVAASCRLCVLCCPEPSCPHAWLSTFLRNCSSCVFQLNNSHHHPLDWKQQIMQDASFFSSCIFQELPRLSNLTSEYPSALPLLSSMALVLWLPAILWSSPNWLSPSLLASLQPILHPTSREMILTCKSYYVNSKFSINSPFSSSRANFLA